MEWIAWMLPLVPRLDTTHMGPRSHGGQIFGTRPTVACRSFLYDIYRNEQNHSLSSVNKLDQRLTIALF